MRICKKHKVIYDGGCYSTKTTRELRERVKQKYPDYTFIIYDDAEELVI